MSDTQDTLVERLRDRDAKIAELERERDSLLKSHRTLNVSGARLEAQVAELTQKLERAPDPTHFMLLAEALAEIKATVDGQSNQPVADIISGCIEEILALPNRARALNSGASQNG